MMRIVLIGLGAGAASALLFASVVSGSPLAALITNFAQLPILIAAIGWTHLGGLAALLFGSAGLTLILGAPVGFLFLITVGLPAWWIGYLVLLARPAEGAEPGALEWYPVGRIVVWTAIVSAAVVMVLLLRHGANMDGVRAALRREIDLFLRLLVALRAANVSDAERTREALVLIVPGMKAIWFTLISLINVWLASLVVKVSGRLRRPWPPIALMTFPPLAPAALAGAVGVTFLPELLGLIGSIFVASLLLAYALLGFAVMHFITLGVGGRGLMLAALYFFALLFSWPLLLVMAMLGLIETMLALRARIAARRPPPPGSINRP
jgi:magnesium-transporting ATPase (P-type)